MGRNSACYELIRERSLGDARRLNRETTVSRRRHGVLGATALYILEGINARDFTFTEFDLLKVASDARIEAVTVMDDAGLTQLTLDYIAACSNVPPDPNSVLSGELTAVNIASQIHQSVDCTRSALQRLVSYGFLRQR